VDIKRLLRAVLSAASFSGILASFCCGANAAPSFPKIAPGDRLGINIHFTDPKPGELGMIAATGAKWVRMDFTWAHTEKVKGQYDFSAYDRLLAALDKYGMHAILILNYGNPLYADAGDKQPFTSRAGTAEFRAAFSAWAAAAVSHFSGRGCLWEIWNEPNYKMFWAPAPNSGEYVALAKAAAAAIRRVAPDEPLIGPASSTIDFKFLEDCFRGGLLEELSAVSVHPYRRTAPSTVAADYLRLRDLIAKYAPAGREIPIISSEWGCSSSWSGFDDQKQAEFLKRELSTNLAAGIPLSIWYDWRDDGVSADDPEHRFGLVRHDYHPGANPPYEAKPAYAAFQEVAARAGQGTP
jgi:hypothetical protein